MIITPLTFLGGTFYSIKMLPPFWQSVTPLNPVVYLVSGFRWAFYGVADVSVGVSAGMTLAFLALCLVCVRWIFKTGTGSRPEPGGGIGRLAFKPEWRPSARGPGRRARPAVVRARHGRRRPAPVPALVQRAHMNIPNTA